jgi:gluconate 2-dehydrogenase gamma chain
MDRRDAIRRMASGAAAPLLGSLIPDEMLAWGREVHSAAANSQPAAGALATALMLCLTAMCERIIPADETPGATAAGVPAFIDRMLADWYDSPERTRVIAGIEWLDTQSRTRFGREFAACSTSDQETLLLELDREGPSHWFGTVKYLTIWGYFTSEIGMVRELGQWPMPGKYDGCAPYSPRRRKASQL